MSIDHYNVNNGDNENFFLNVNLFKFTINKFIFLRDDVVQESERWSNFSLISLF